MSAMVSRAGALVLSTAVGFGACASGHASRQPAERPHASPQELPAPPPSTPAGELAHDAGAQSSAPAAPESAGATTTEVAPAPSDPLAAEQAAYERARPVFERHCARCHTTAGSKAKRGMLSHFNMDQYPFGGHHADEIAQEIRLVLGAAGKPPTMPRDDKGAVRGEELTLVLAWADAFDEAHASQAHERHGNPRHSH
jgi:hypothetical protein